MSKKKDRTSDYFAAIFAIIIIGIPGSIIYFGDYLPYQETVGFCIEKGYDGGSRVTDKFEGKLYVKCHNVIEKLGQDEIVHEWVVKE